MSYKVSNNHTKEEYDKKYGDKDLKVLSVEEVTNDESLLENKNWWLIEDKYYEVDNSKCAFLVWWMNLKTIFKSLIIAGIVIIITMSIIIPTVIIPSINNKNNPTDELAETINLEYYSENNYFSYTFDESLKSIKSNQTSWTISITQNNNKPSDWYVAFYYVIDQDNAVLIARSQTHNGSAVVGSYNENVVLEKDINLLDYKDKTLQVWMCCLSC